MPHRPSASAAAWTSCVGMARFVGLRQVRPHRDDLGPPPPRRRPPRRLPGPRANPRPEAHRCRPRPVSAFRCSRTGPARRAVRPGQHGRLRRAPGRTPRQVDAGRDGQGANSSSGTCSQPQHGGGDPGGPQVQRLLERPPPRAIPAPAASAARARPGRRRGRTRRPSPRPSSRHRTAAAEPERSAVLCRTASRSTTTSVRAAVRGGGRLIGTGGRDGEVAPPRPARPGGRRGRAACMCEAGTGAPGAPAPGGRPARARTSRHLRPAGVPGRRRAADRDPGEHVPRTGRREPRAPPRGRPARGRPGRPRPSRCP